MIIFTAHSLLKLKQRAISKKLVVGTVKNPDFISQSYGNRSIYLKKFGKLYLKVVCKNEAENVIIITQHWVEKIS